MSSERGSQSCVLEDEEPYIQQTAPGDPSAVALWKHVDMLITQTSNVTVITITQICVAIEDLRANDVPQCVILFIQCEQTCIRHLGVFNYCDSVKGS